MYTNKKTPLTLQKAAIAISALLIIINTLGCSKTIGDDRTLLELIIEKNNFNKTDSLYLVNKANTNNLLEFFRYRNTYEELISHTNKDSSRPTLKDSITFAYDSTIIKPRPIISNEYIMRGKGIDPKAETFLKDSFNYKKDSINWNLKKELYNVSPETSGFLGQKLKISKPKFF